VVTFRQAVGGVEVFHSDARVLLRQNLELVAISGALHPAAIPTSSHAFPLAEEQALAAAVVDLTTAAVPASALGFSGDDGRYHRYTLTPTAASTADGIAFSRPARLARTLFPLGRSLKPAYLIELYVSASDVIEGGHNDGEYFRYVIDADDGAVLYRENLSQSDVFNYRVWADPSAPFIPLDGPQQDYTPHPTGMPDMSDPGPMAPVLVPMEGFNTNPNNVADPWLPAGATESVGNNVDAYSDHSGPDGFTAGDIRATVTSPNTFDRVYDVTLEPLANTNQTMASATQLFFVNNWLHDYFYDSGFDEAAGNAQENNYGRGGEENDPIHAEAQDAALTNTRNNANMSTPDDGESPRMQMYLWTSAAEQYVDIQPLNLQPNNARASFGPQSYDVTAPIVLADDGSGTSTDACEPLVNNVAGQMVLVDRGSCSFVVKIANVQAAGGIAGIVANNQNTAPFTMTGNPPQPINIPSMMIGQADGQTLKAALMSGAQTGHMFRETTVERDGTIDNSIVAHEWGHYLHRRLADGGNQAFGAMSEGWADFVGLFMGLRPGDDVTGTYAVGVYATANGADSGYFGIRRFPYSRDQTKNALSFRHIQDGEALPSLPMDPTSSPNSEVHAAGEVWSQMLWNGFTAMIQASEGPNAPYDFDTAKRR
ncbi:MAG: M36 family metallopeptidase, partial [Myxococcales bacterium]|nr:M36 family metallopeptidase [Myxococcales bacterium]